MKFLLVAVNAKYIHSNPAVYSLRAYAGTKYHKHIEIAEYTINNYAKDILADIYIRQPDAIGFSCYIWNWTLIQEIIADLHKLIPKLPIWLGGPEVTYKAHKILKQYSFLTGIMVGEGEASFRDLMEYYAADMEVEHSMEKEGLEKTPGLCISSGYTPIRTPVDMNTLPFLYEEVDSFSDRIIYYESSRGCPYRCSYCLSSIESPLTMDSPSTMESPSTMDNLSFMEGSNSTKNSSSVRKRVRLRDINVVKKELQYFLDNKVKQVKFVDRTFNCIHEHAMAVWQYLHENDNGITNFHFEISAEILREDEILLLGKMRPGLVQLEIGVQSANPHTLEAVHRFFDLEKLKHIVAAIHKNDNIHQHLDLIAGLPYEDYTSFGESFNKVYDMKPQQLQLGFLKVLKGSEMYDMAQEYGICYSSLPPYEVLYTKWLPYQDVLRLKKIEEMVEQYYNSNQFRHTLCFLKRVFLSPFAMFEAMADFWSRKGYFANSPARVYRYQNLLEFAEEWDKENGMIYRELLLYDMYLRENLKSRPDFAPDITSHKEEISRFYQDEEKSRKWLPDYSQFNAKQMRKMTHMEFFYYPVWDMCLEEDGNILSEENRTDTGGGYVLFDYRKRDLLTREAGTLTFRL